MMIEANRKLIDSIEDPAHRSAILNEIIELMRLIE